MNESRKTKMDMNTIAEQVNLLNRSKGNEKGLNTLWLSFEEGYQCGYRVYFPERVRITGIKGIVIKVLAPTDSGTVTGANTTGNSESGVLTFPMSAALANEKTATPTTNNIVEAGSYYKLTSRKTTPGGAVLVTLQYTKIN